MIGYALCFFSGCLCSTGAIVLRQWYENYLQRQTSISLPPLAEVRIEPSDGSWDAESENPF
jgi:hypothetical protein